MTDRLRAVLGRVWKAYRRLRVEYRAQRHAWAVERAALLERIARAEDLVRKLKAEVARHARARFGRRSEQKESAEAAAQQGETRGQRRGEKGHGRVGTRYQGLPVVDVVHDVPEGDKRCGTCGTPRIEVAADVADELDVRLVVRCVRHHRKCYVAACGCQGTEPVIRAEAATKLIPRCSLSYSAISFCVVARYLWGLPLHRITTILGQHGARVPDGTLVGIFKAVQPLLQALYDATCERNRQSEYLHADETTWRQLWMAKGKRGYVWCFAGPDTTVYVFDPGRDHSVVLKHLGLEGREWGGQVVRLICDFLASYDKAAKLANATERRLELFRCWSHYRRLFLDIPTHHPADRRVETEVAEWLGMIADLFRLHHERDVAADGSAEQELAQAAFRGCLQEMEEVRARHLRRRKLAPELRHVLDYGALHWEELTRCAVDPHLPIDNNFDERQIRLPVIIRKNAYGSGAHWAADEACQVWTIGKSALQNGCNPSALITAYFEACAQAGDKVPADWEGFLPWAFGQGPSEGVAAATRPAATAVDSPAASTSPAAETGAEQSVSTGAADLPPEEPAAEQTSPAPLTPSQERATALPPASGRTRAPDLSGDRPAPPDPPPAEGMGTHRPVARVRTARGTAQRRFRARSGLSLAFCRPP